LQLFRQRRPRAGAARRRLGEQELGIICSSAWWTPGGRPILSCNLTWPHAGLQRLIGEPRRWAKWPTLQSAPSRIVTWFGRELGSTGIRPLSPSASQL